MRDWRKSTGNWEPGSRPMRHGRPPHPPGPSYSSVPAWEKRFCTTVCSIPWKKICEAKGVMPIYKNVVEWNDSAALEAFQNAKARFWAEINGLPCDIPVPDPDMYIDKVDHDAVIDPELVADLEKQPSPTNEDNDADIGWDSFLFANKPVPVSGWGDEEDPVPSNNYAEEPIVPTGWEDVEYSVPQNDISAEPNSSCWDIKHDTNNTWNAASGINNVYSDNAWNCSAGWGHGIVQNNSWEAERDMSWDNGWKNGIVQNNSWGDGQDNSWDSRRDNSYGIWESRDNEPGWTRGGGCHSGFRTRKSRYQVHNYQMNNRWTDSRGSNRMNYPYEKTMYAKQSLAML